MQVEFLVLSCSMNSVRLWSGMKKGDSMFTSNDLPSCLISKTYLTFQAFDYIFGVAMCHYWRCIYGRSVDRLYDLSFCTSH